MLSRPSYVPGDLVRLSNGTQGIVIQVLRQNGMAIKSMGVVAAECISHLMPYYYTVLSQNGITSFFEGQLKMVSPIPELANRAPTRP